MNILHHIATFHLILLPLLAPLPALAGQGGVSLAQVPADNTPLPPGIEATGDTVEARALYEWAKEHQYSYPEESSTVARRALALGKKLNDQRVVGESLTTLGNLAENLDQKEAYYIEAHEAFEQLGNEQLLARSQLSLGNLHREKNELLAALTYYFDALEGLEKSDDVEGQAIVLNNIGNVHKDQEELDEALEWYKKALSMISSVDNPIPHIYILNNIGVIFLERESYENAWMHFRRALAISEEQGTVKFTIAISNNIGRLLNKEGRYREALPYLFEVERLSRRLGEDDVLFAAYDELANAYKGLGDYDQALHYAHEGLALAQQTGVIPRQTEIHRTLSEIYALAGNYEQAFLQQRQYAAARDSVFTAEKAEIVTQMQTRYETEEKQRAIERLEQENQIQALQLILLLGAVVVAFLVAGLFYYRYRLKQKANRLLEELDAAKSRFFANISHEFRTPLTAILGSAQDALAGRFEGDRKKLTEQHRAILRNTRRLHGLIDEVLELNRLEAGKLELKPVAGDVVQLLRRLVEAVMPLAERNGIRLTFKCAVETCPRFYDAEKLEKIVGNLLSNALKFTPTGGEVHVRLCCGRETEVVVSDDGPGIPAEAQENVFERFEQFEENGRKGGSGIGLALAKELAELHGGAITLESEPGKGSTFTVRLPLDQAAVADIQGNTPRPFGTPPSRGEFRVQTAPLGGLPAPQGWGGGVPSPEEELGIGGDGAPQSEESQEESDRTTILIIEDNDDVRAYIQRSLEDVYRVSEVAGGEKGLQQARMELPDLIISDVMLPGMDGYEVVRRLKAEPATECIPVVMLTARAAEEDQTEGYGSGAEVYITKPFAPQTLRSVCSRLLKERQRLRRRLLEEAEAGGEEWEKNGFSSLRDRARVVVIENLYDEDFGVEELASALNMTRRTLYNRIKSEVGGSPSDFIRTLRLERGRELLSNGVGSVSEVAYAVGFRSLVAFSRAYSAHYGTPPSSHLSQG